MVGLAARLCEFMPSVFRLRGFQIGVTNAPDMFTIRRADKFNISIKVFAGPETDTAHQLGATHSHCNGNPLRQRARSEI